jgi:hypothetical protein
MFPSYRAMKPRDRHSSADPLGATMHQKETQSDVTFVPGAAPVGYVNAYDEGRPKH